MVIAAGGFGANRPMLRAHAPSARGGLPLATPGDDGSGIRLGTEAGGVTACLDRVSVWRFLTPPPALVRGVLVGRDGQRICDESRYGAAIGDAIVRGGGQAWLLVDHATLAAARRQVRGSTLWFQRLQAWYLLFARPGDRGDRRRGRDSGRRRPRRARGDGSRLQRAPDVRW